MKGYSKPSYSVIWRSSKKGWITRTLFQEWFTSYFCPAVKEYCQAKNIENKALLILDNAPGHPPGLDDLRDNVQVVFLPSNTSSLIQPMDQGVIATFKAYYLRRTFKQAINFLGSDGRHTLKESWRGYHIMNAIENLAVAWHEAKTSTMNLAWRKICPEAIAELTVLEQPLQNVHRELGELAHEVGFSDINEEDILELLESHDEELSNKDLMEMELAQEEEGDKTEDRTNKHFDY
ncbi:hypothetical protein M514_25302 [Trichuris suis]|uniref:DDE-1 domain-containing protein n=1 Tax=Trichuris suis TaxID=68888 RepID=A0A085MZC0_9BILA|nr:hypothetical protein M514_25302 [Trichuris suis]